MRVNFKLFLFAGLFMLLLVGPTMLPAATTAVDTSMAKPVVRMPDKSRMAKYKKDSAFNYEQDVSPAPSLIGKIKAWIAEFFRKLFTGKNYDGFWKYVLWILVAIGVGFIILKLMGVELTGFITGRKAVIDLSETTLHENVHEMDFDVLLNDALQNRQYRLAVRFNYLKSLKLLSDHSYIDWHPNKTNRAYLMELGASPIRTMFEPILLKFEYIWYGELELNKDSFELLNEEFRSFNKRIHAA